MTEPLVLAADGEPMTPGGVREVIGHALALGVDTVVVPVERLEPAFFDLRTGTAGEIVQAFTTYRLRLVVLGELPPAASSSGSFAAFVREADRGRQTWFVETIGELETRIAAET